jgi:DNA-directed RNA polymerase specialized sigma subunit
MRAVAECAAWQAECDYDPSRGVPFIGFARQRVVARALAHYRREWAYARHGGNEVDCDTLASTSPDPAHMPLLTDEVRQVVNELPRRERTLVKQLFWGNVTESELARQAGLTQQAISKRKRVTLVGLRRWFAAPSIATPPASPRRRTTRPRSHNS